MMPQNLECDELIVASSSKCKGILTGVMKINHGEAGMARSLVWCFTER